MTNSQRQLVKRAIDRLERIERCSCFTDGSMDEPHRRDTESALAALRAALALVEVV